MSRLVDVGTWLHAGSFSMTLSECATIGPESRAKTPDVPVITKSLTAITPTRYTRRWTTKFGARVGVRVVFEVSK